MPMSRMKQRQFPIGGSWGRHVEWVSTGPDDLKVTGHWTPVPKVGELITSPMSSGKTGLFVITSVETFMDPPDQFFATVSFTGYRPA